MLIRSWLHSDFPGLEWQVALHRRLLEGRRFPYFVSAICAGRGS
jgi:hypothetical protein